jgi:two-component system sensor histidine kinase/response regulator
MESNKILIIDDMSTHLLLLQTILEEEGYEVAAIDNGKEAMETIEHDQDIKLILLDIMMPELDGYQILDKVKSEDKNVNIPVIVVSAKTDSSSIKKALEKGAYDYITKPLNVYDIKNKIKSALT